MTAPRLGAVCVFCGSRSGARAGYRDAARILGERLAGAGVRLVYGGGNIGLMGELARAVLAGGGRVTAVIPHFLTAREVGDPGVDELVVVDSMHERKQRMFDLADGFVVLPGGLGTFDETIEVITWRQLGLHDKPVVLLDVDGYWARLRALFQAAVEEGFADRDATSLFRLASGPDEALAAIAAALPAAAVPDSERL